MKTQYLQRSSRPKAILKTLLALCLVPLMLAQICQPIVPGRDFSDFQKFEFTQNSALGFCPDMEAVYSATINKQADGSYLLAMSVIEEGDAGVDECSTDLPLLISDTCAVVRSLPDRTLTPTEVTRLLAAFSSVSLQTSNFNGLCIDPCRVGWYGWDDYYVADTLAGCLTGEATTLGSDESDEILALLEELRSDVSK